MKDGVLTEPFDIVVFGGGGDLALHKLLPAFYQLDRHCRLPADGRIIAVLHTPVNHAEYLTRAEAMARQIIPADELVPELWSRFAARLSCVAFDARIRAGYAALEGVLAQRADLVRVFYLATPPGLFGAIAAHLAAAALITPKSRVVLEKPIGHDLASSHAVNRAVGEVFAEGQIYRIDHYLGKEAVQNLMVLRFANSLFEPLWNRTYIDHVQVTVAESIGVAGRRSYYDGAGALRDMVQNHMLQLLCLAAMEPPIALDADAVRDEKLKVLKSLVPIMGPETANLTVRGQYRAGAINGTTVPGYQEESDAAGSSTAETFVALKAGIDNWRWSGVPFYLRTGKRLPQRSSEIVVQFRAPPHLIYPPSAESLQPNRLLMRLQPNEGVRLFMLNKQPGPGDLRLRQLPLNLSFADAFGMKIPDAYERLLLDVIRGRSTLFMRVDELEAAWRWTDAIHEAWEHWSVPVKPYAAGTWGPTTAVALIERDGRTWYEDDA